MYGPNNKMERFALQNRVLIFVNSIEPTHKCIIASVEAAHSSTNITPAYSVRTQRHRKRRSSTFADLTPRSGITAKHCAIARTAANA